MSSKRRERRDRKLRQRRRKPQRTWAPPGELQEVDEPNRLAYSRKQAAEALGVSISTVDRYLVPTLNTVKTPWGQRLIPVASLERFVQEHLVPGRGRPPPRPIGRPPSLPQSVVERIRLEWARGRSLGEIARDLIADGVPTAHGGRRWWPSTVRAVLLRELNVGGVRRADPADGLAEPGGEVTTASRRRSRSNP